jgi:hypothetical protein
MPTLVSKVLTAGNLTGSNNFLSVINTANAFVISGTVNAALTTNYIGSPSFVGAGETLTAFGLEISGVAVTTGITINIRLLNISTSTQYNYTYAADLVTTGGRGWNYFALEGDGVVLTAGDSWQILIASNVINRVYLMRGGTVGSWNRMFVTNSDATVASGDTLYLGGRLLTAGSVSNTSIVLDSSVSLENLIINNGASLNWTANNLTLTLSGNLILFPGSSFTVGTSLNPVSGLIEFATTALGQDAFSAFGPCIFNIYGTDISSDYYIDLASTANAGQANAVLASAPDWVNGQLVTYTSSRTTIASEIRTVSSVSGNTVTNTTNFANTHDVRVVGTYAQVQDTAKACLMNRGFVVANTTASSGSWYGSIYGAVTCNWDNVFFRDFGANVTAAGIVPSKFGWMVDITTGGSFTVDNCSFFIAAQTNVGVINSENSSARLGTTYTITNCLAVFRTGTTGFLIRNGAPGSDTIINNCIMISTTANNGGYLYYARTLNSANVSMDNCYSYGSTYTVYRVESSGISLGSFSMTNCFSIGQGFYFGSPIYPTSNANPFVVGNTTISNCVAINRLGSGVGAAFQLSGLINTYHTIDSCKFVGFNRYLFPAQTVEPGTLFNNCIFEDDAATGSQTQILVGTNSRPNVAFKNCYFSTTFLNQSFIVLNWVNLPVYSGGSFSFKDCSFNGNGDQFVPSSSLRFFNGFNASLENCLFRDTANTITRNYVMMGTATVSADTFSGSGASVALTPYSINETTFPFNYQFLLPTKEANFTVNFKTKAYGLNGIVRAYIRNAFGIISQSTLTVSSSWDSQSIAVSTGGPYTELLNLTIELTGTAGYLVIDAITVGSTSGIIGESGKYAFLDTSGSAVAAETSHLFC